MRRARLLRALRAEDGYTLVELVAVLAILLTIVTVLTSLFVSGAKAELDMNRRFQAQQAARIAADRLRREVHCASGITLADGGASATVTLPGHCPTAVGGSTTTVVYATESVGGSTDRYRLKRGSTQVADYLTSPTVFSYVAPSTSSLGKLHVDLRVNVNPNEGWKLWHLETDVVLRNTTRTG